MEIIAKSNPREILSEHIENLIQGLKQLLKLYGDEFTEKEKKLIKLAIKYHDDGKAIYPFQKKMYDLLKEKFPYSKEMCDKLDDLYKNQRKIMIPHGYLSPAFLDFTELEKEFDNTDIRTLVNAIVWHHVRNYEFVNKDIIEWINNDLQVNFPEQKLQIKYLNCVYTHNREPDGDEEWVQYAVIKGVLNKTDYWASSNREVDIEISPLHNGKNIAELVEEKLIKEDKSLRDLQIYMKNNKDNNIIVVASTGTGKTEGALLWIGEHKAFYTLPLRVSINEIYKRIKKEYNYPEEKLGLLHSNAIAYLIQLEEQNSVQKYNIARDLSYPITMCTIDQLFKFIYKYKGSEIFLATLKYSKLVLDEIQAYSPELLGKIIYALKLITMAGGKFAIITATLPPVIPYLLRREDIGIPFETPEKGSYESKSNRHKIFYQKRDFDYEKIVSAGKDKKVLVICNTVKKAQKVYKILNGLEKFNKNIHLLHSRFTQGDRQILEHEIIAFADSKNCVGIWVVTQIVEASLDIDFDVLYTEMCSADSLLQRMGRCYRKREWYEEYPNIHIYDTENGVSKRRGSNGIYDRFIYNRSVKYLEKYNNQIFTEKMKTQYIDDVYNVNELKDSEYYEKINETIKSFEDMDWDIYSKTDADKIFRDINSVSIMPESVVNEFLNKEDSDYLIDLIKSKDKNKEKDVFIARKKIMDYVVNVTNIKRSDIVLYIDELQIYKAPYKYDFDKETKKGMGLTYEVEDSNNI